jgi:hypothetical protein
MEQQLHSGVSWHVLHAARDEQVAGAGNGPHNTRMRAKENGAVRQAVPFVTLGSPTGHGGCLQPQARQQERVFA